MSKVSTSALAEFVCTFTSSLQSLQNYASTIVESVAEPNLGDKMRDLPNCLYLWILGNYGPEYQQFKHTESLNLSLGAIFKVNGKLKATDKIDYCAKNIVKYAQKHLSEYQIPMERHIQYKPHPELFEKYSFNNAFRSAAKLDDAQFVQIEYKTKHDVVNVPLWFYKKHKAKHTLEEIYSITKLYSTFWIMTRETEHLSLPPEVYAQLKQKYKVELECFATPFNCNLSKFCSPFPYVDYIFGSVGNFCYMKNINLNCTCNVPFTEDVYKYAAKTMVESVIKNNITVIFIAPNWTDCEGYNILKDYIDKVHPGQFDKYFKCLKIKYISYNANGEIKQIYPSSTFRFILC